MPGILDDLEGLQLIGMNVDAVLVGGADEGEEPGRIFSYLNLNRAFLELEAGAELYCLHKNRWWQTADGPRLDAGAFVAGLEYAAGIEATVLGKPSRAYFAAALEAIDADPELTWMVGDDLEGDIVGARQFGMRTMLVRTGKFRPDELEHSTRAARRDRLVDRPAAGLARGEPVSDAVGGRPDRDRPHPPRARTARRRLPGALLHRGRARVLRLEAEPAAALRRPVRREGGGGQGARLGRLLHLEGDRDPRPAEARRPPERAARRRGPSGSARGTIELSMTHSRELAAAVAVALEA